MRKLFKHISLESGVGEVILLLDKGSCKRSQLLMLNVFLKQYICSQKRLKSSKLELFIRWNDVIPTVLRKGNK